MDISRIIKGPDTEFGEFIRFIDICMLMTEKPGTNWVEYFSENSIDIFSGCSILAIQCMSGNILKVSALLSSSLPLLYLPLEINSMNYDR